MGWTNIPCPKIGGVDVSWDTCLRCEDADKAPECPAWVIRHDLAPRPVTPGSYHVTELYDLRRSFFERTHDYSASWDEYALDFWIGKAAHAYLEQSYLRKWHDELPEGSKGIEREWRERYYSWNLGDDIRVVGSPDLLDLLHIPRVLHEFKTYGTIKFLLKRNEPEPEHVFQAQTYVKLIEELRPFDRPDIVRITYLAKAKLPRPIFTGKGMIIPNGNGKDGKPERRYLEFNLAAEATKDVPERARGLDAALRDNVVPNGHCAEWKCDGCHHAKECASRGWTS